MAKDALFAKSGFDLHQVQPTVMESVHGSTQNWWKALSNETDFFFGCSLALCPQLLPVRADASSAFEKALYGKARYQVVGKLNDEDFVSYCTTMNVGRETLLKFHDEILAKQTELTNLANEGLSENHPRILAVTAQIKDLRAEYAIKIGEARKGWEIESRIAEETLAALSQSQK